jgi:hypothetical protein
MYRVFTKGLALCVCISFCRGSYSGVGTVAWTYAGSSVTSLVVKMVSSAVEHGVFVVKTILKCESVFKVVKIYRQYFATVYVSRWNSAVSSVWESNLLVYTKLFFRWLCRFISSYGLFTSNVSFEYSCSLCAVHTHPIFQVQYLQKHIVLFINRKLSDSTR